MSPSYTTTEIVSRIRRTAQLAVQNKKLTDAQILEIADEAIQSTLWPMLRSSAEEYAMSETYLTITPGASAPYPDSVRLPSRASSSTIHLVSLSQPGWVGDHIVPRFDVAAQIAYGNGVMNNQIAGAYPGGWVMFGDRIRVMPALTQTTILRVVYERRPSRLTAVANCAAIESWDSGTGEFVTDGVPDAFTVDMSVDIVRHAQQATDPIVDDASVTAISDPNVTLDFGDTTTGATTVYATLSPGDFICEAGFTCVFPLPDVWWPVAIARASADALIQCGYSSEAAVQESAFARGLEAAQLHSANRVRRQPQKMFDRGSTLRTPYVGWRRGGMW